MRLEVPQELAQRARQLLSDAAIPFQEQLFKSLDVPTIFLLGSVGLGDIANIVAILKALRSQPHPRPVGPSAALDTVISQASDLFGSPVVDVIVVLEDGRRLPLRTTADAVLSEALKSEAPDSGGDPPDCSNPLGG